MHTWTEAYVKEVYRKHRIRELNTNQAHSQGVQGVPLTPTTTPANPFIEKFSLKNNYVSRFGGLTGLAEYYWSFTVRGC
jgi:hypothetical protein